ncbi:MAG: Gfo/Idh/MocA family protein [Candidatus Zipacnadales bacterium]
MVQKAKTPISRRAFLHQAGMTAAGVVIGRGSSAQARSPNERLGVGLIGCGGRMGAHIGTIQQLQGEGWPVEIVAVADIYTPRLEAAVQRTKGKPYRDYRELLADPHVDVVAIASPDRHHGPQAIDAMLAGKDVFSEKPLVHWQQFDVLKRLAHLAQETGRIVQVGTQYVADSIWRQARQLIKEGLLGKLIHLQVGYFRQGDWGERGMAILDPNARPGPDLDWEAFLGDAPRREFEVSRFFRWRMYLDYAGGPPTDLYPHVFTPLAIACDLGFPTRVAGAGGKLFYNHEREVPDTVNILADYPEGLTVALLGTQVNARGLETCIRGSEGTICFEGPGIRIYPPDGKAEPLREVPRERPGDLRELWINFLNCVKSREQPWSDVQTQYRVQTMLNMGLLSMIEGKMAHFDAENERIII